jgi:hypothetical protein
MQVFIQNGCLSLGSFLEWQLFTAKGEPAEFNYRGEAMIADSQIRVASSSVSVSDYTISEYPTKKSAEIQKGYLMAQRQKVKRWPTKQSEAFQSGWQIGWKEKNVAQERRLCA